MITQHIHAKKPGAGLGLLIVLGLFAGFLALVSVTNYFVQQTGIGQISYLVILAAIAAGIVLMRKFILEYRYTLNESVLYFERLYGRQNRVLAQVPLRQILWIGDREEIAEKIKEKIENTSDMTLPSCDIPHKALLYRKDKLLLCIVFQPNAELLAAIEEGRRNTVDPFTV
ncbi:MAG: hypothetical protein ACOYI8_08480 [Christensenellales bacterium]|jgi:hypothetical protein